MTIPAAGRGRKQPAANEGAGGSDDPPAPSCSIVVEPWCQRFDYSREIVSFFLAEGLAPGAPANAADETLDVAHFSGEQIRALVREGRTDAKTLAGLALAGRLPSLVDR